jgi:hypothetical protein
MKEVIVAYFKILISSFPEMSEEKTCGPRIEPGNSQITSRVLNSSVPNFS